MTPTPTAEAPAPGLIRPAAAPPINATLRAVFAAGTMGTAWFLALCAQCGDDLAQPFRDEDERDTWAAEHLTATGHVVRLAVDQFEDIVSLHLTAVIRRVGLGQFEFQCRADGCSRWNGPYPTAQSAIASWRQHKPPVTP